MIAPPRPRPASTPAVQVLFEEARRRRRRIRVAGLAVVLAVAVVVTVLAAILSSGQPRTGGSPSGSSGANEGGSRSGVVAWVDYNNRLHLGNLTALTQRVVAEVGADPTTPLVAASGRVYWVDTAGTFVPSLGHWSEVVQELDIATGRIHNVAPGQWIFPSADGRNLYISQGDDASLIQLPASGRGAPRRLVLPTGWYLPGGFGVAVGDGILVQSTSDAMTSRPTEIAVWSPGTRTVKFVGRILEYYGIIGAYTPPGGRSGLLAWIPAGCRSPTTCPIELTNTSTLASKTLLSPFRFGFAAGGAFSPDGRELAVFVHRGPGGGGGSAELAVVDTSSGVVRLVTGARLRLGEDVAWARWLPGGKELIAGDVGNEYIVSITTLSSKRFSFEAGSGPATGGSQQVDFSVTVASRH